ncbi:hypothetical protein BB559_001640 [Furculomyces boomerangus]|uniref:Carbohydrate kinase PfkB domain-containing protein n=2 Tax=Harpellales TaxID=61421 RepID=A0A2T9Z1A4_9FUNG|nr:hypothetical protein BB559_001640 [Furculomyces boomerangus]PVZ98887.1 hypothetical protein BB558_005111 [Smittium angustum]
MNDTENIRVYRSGTQHCRVLCLGSNPALQYTLIFQKLDIGKVNRSAQQITTLGGKGQGFAIATRAYYGDSHNNVVLQPIGGYAGDQILELQKKEKLDCISVMVNSCTRTATTIIDNSTKEITELVGTSEPISEFESKLFVDAAIKLLCCEQHPKALSICGSFAKGLSINSIVEIVKSKHPETLLFVDSVDRIENVLELGNTDILKINVDEIKSLGLRVLDNKDSADSTRNIITGISKLYNIKYIALTNGPLNAIFYSSDTQEFTEIQIPDISSIVSTMQSQENIVINPIGCGDTCSGVFLNLVVDGEKPLDAFIRGLAAASASCFSLAPNSKFDKKIMEEINLLMKTN